MLVLEGIDAAMVSTGAFRAQKLQKIGRATCFAVEEREPFRTAKHAKRQDFKQIPRPVLVVLK